MRLTVTPPPAGAAWRSFHFSPPDPWWASGTMLARVRRQIREFDPRLNIWWSTSRAAGDPKTPGRWRIVEWLAGSGDWSTAFYWEGPNKEFRPIEPLGPVLAKLRRIAEPIDVVHRRIEEANEIRREAGMAERRAVMREHFEDYGDRLSGRRIVVGAGGRPRTRAFTRGQQLVLPGTNYERWLRKHNIQ